MADQTEAGLKAELQKQLLALLAGGQAHADFEKVIGGMPEELRGERPAKLPYSAWQLVEHLRITQRDILDFCTNADGEGYRHLQWPKEYWTKETMPASAAAWDAAVEAIRSDRKSFEGLLTTRDADLTTPFAWGEGQTLLREALLSADHTAYHLGELVLLRRLLGAWEG